MSEMEQELSRWSVSDAADAYEIARWSGGYFSINEAGHVAVHPTRSADQAIDLKRLVDRLAAQGIQTPVLIRFADVLNDRLEAIRAAFSQAMDDHDYQAEYRCLYPIKVNQQRQVVEEVLRFGQAHRYGLEAGSKPELLAVVAMAADDVPIVCNGFKDEPFIETALLAQKIGRQVFLVVEKFSELDLILRLAEQIGVRPRIGMRVKLAAGGAGRWHASGGYRSKFGLTVSDLLRALAKLQDHGLADCFKMLHFHQGSQITNIRHVKAALNEAARIYVELVRHGAGLEYLDVGGGLGVDYDGSQTNFESSANYTLQEYANDVIYHVQTVCDDAGVAHPTIFSESGRAVVAYHSVLVFNVLGASSHRGREDFQPLPDDAEQPLRTLADTFADLTVRNLLESYHDAQQALEMAMHLFGGGYLPLVQRSQAENLFWAICRKIRRLADQLGEVPEELQNVDALLGETYFCNFSVFQSLPDSWAIKQLFPVMPIHRLQEAPTRHAVLGDITCDSDGKIDRFIDRRDLRRILPLHELDGRPYYLAAFLVGAYQEILGDLHNLFGDTNAVHVTMEASGEVTIDTVVAGDTVREVLHYVQFDADDLFRRMQAAVDAAVGSNRIAAPQADRLLECYRAGLDGYTYLDETQGPQQARGDQP